MHNSICVELYNSKRDGRNVVVLVLSTTRSDGSVICEYPIVEGGLRPVDLESIHLSVAKLITDWALLYAPPQLTLLDAVTQEARSSRDPF